MPSKSNETTTKFKADITDLKSSMQEAARYVRLANSEFKAATAGMQDWSNSADGLSAKVTQLTNVIEAQKRQLETLETQYNKVVDEQGENSKAAQDLMIRINNQKAAIKNNEAQLTTYQDKLEKVANATEDAGDETQQFSSESEKLKSKISDQQAKLDALKKSYVDLQVSEEDTTEESKALAQEIDSLSKELQDSKSKLADAEKAADELDNTFNDLDDSADKATEGFTVMKGVLADLAATAIKEVLNGLKDLAAETFNAGANFESAMSQVEAISGASAEEMELLTAKAKEMGETTKFSATESAEAFNYMAMAGWKTEDMINGIAGIMQLAAASGEDLATTSDIVTDALTAMGYSAGDAGKLADVMAAASANANTNVSMMGQTFQYAAPIIGALGYNMEDAAVAIGLMANAGIKGEKSGTALRSILTRLSAPPTECAKAMDELGISLTDSEGNMKSLDEVMQDLRNAFDGLSETEQTAYAKSIAGQEAMSGLLAIVNAAPEDFDKLTKAVEDSTGAAEEMANTMNDTVSGQLTLLQSNVEGKMIKVFEKASPSIKKALKQIFKALDSVNWDKVADSIGTLAIKFADFATYVANNGDKVKKIILAVGTALTTVFVANKITSFVSAAKTIAPVFTTLATKIGILTVATDAQEASQLALNTTMLASPLTWLVAGFAALTVGVIAYNNHVKEQIQAEYGLNEAQKETIDNINQLKDSYDSMESARQEANASVQSEYSYLKELKDEYNSLIDSNGSVKEGYEDRANFILNELAQALGIELEQLQAEIDKNGELGDSINELIRLREAEAILSANQSSYTEAIQNRTEAFENYMDAQDLVAEKEEAYNNLVDEANEYLETHKGKFGATEESIIAYSAAYQDIIDQQEAAKEALDEANKALEDSEEAYIGYNTTIANYEGLSSAIISGDTTKIQTALNNMVYNFQTAETGTRTSLENQLTNLQDTYSKMQTAIENNTPGVTQEMVDQAKSMVDAAQAELDKLPDDAETSGTETGSRYAGAIAAQGETVSQAGSNLATSAKSGLSSGSDEIGAEGTTAGLDYASELKAQATNASASGQTLASNANLGIGVGSSLLSQQGTQQGKNYSTGIESTKGGARTSGNSIATSAKNGIDSVEVSSSGVNFGQGFINGLASMAQSAWTAGWNFVKSAWAGLKAGQEEGSPSKLTKRSGVFFGQGFEIGINNTLKDVVNTATSLAVAAVDALQEESEGLEGLGENAGVSFADGLKSSISEIKKSVEEMASPLDTLQTSTQTARAIVGTSNSSTNGSSTGSSNSAKTTNLTFNQYNNSPKSLDRLTIYRETNSLLFSAKVRAENV